MDTSARQKHRPSRQARRKATAAIRFFPFKIIKSSCARAARAPYGLGFRTFPNDQRDKLPFGNLYCIEVQYVPINNEDEKTFCSSVIAVRVSGGHLCEAEAPTEPAGETAARCVAIRLFFKGNTDSFAPSAQNDKEQA